MSPRIRLSVMIVAVGLVFISLLWPIVATDAAPAGTVRFLDSTNTAMIDTDVRVLCYRTSSSDAPFLDIVLHTDSSGQPVGGLPAGCDYLAALHEMHAQPSGSSEHGPAYWIYATSWAPGTTDPKSAAGDVYIRDDWSLVLFNVVASLGWEPAPESGFTAELREGLRSASDYLYDLTEGQMAFGPIAIHSGGRRWASADMRFLPANEYRPSAYVGGVVSESVAYTATATLSETVFVPGNVFLGRYWDGDDAFDPVSGTWSTPAANRTLVHEWAHHALFLYDEYQTTAGSRTYCACELPSLSGCPSADMAASAMAFHYTAGELWYPPVHGEPAVCKTTRQWQVHGMDDWKTLTYWDDIQSLPAPIDMLRAPGGLDAAGPPSGLTGDLFGRSTAGYRTYLPAVAHDGTPTMTPTEPLINVLLPASAGLRVTDTLPTQIYTLDEITDGTPDRILHQGRAIGPPKPAERRLGDNTLFDITQEDGVRVFVDRYRTPGRSGGRFVFPGSPSDDGLIPSDPFDAETQSSSWPASLDASFALTGDRFDTLTMTLTAPALNVAPGAQLCDMDAGIGCHSDWQQTMVQPDPLKSEWVAVFTPRAGADELPPYGIVRVTTPDGELIRWYQMLGGVGPAHKDGHAPLRDGPVMVDTNEAVPEPGRCNRVLVMPAAEYSALQTSLPTDQQGAQIKGVVGLPLDIDVLLADTGRCAGLTIGDHTLPIDILVTLFYGQKQLDDAGIDEADLRLLHFNRVTNQPFWAPMNAFGQSIELNWLTTEPVSEDGIYAIGYVDGN